MVGLFRKANFLFVLLYALTINHALLAEPFNLNVSGKTVSLYDYSFNPTLQAQIEFQTSVSTVKMKASATASVQKADVIEVAKRLVQKLAAVIDTHVCTFDLKSIDNLDIDIKGNTAFIDASLSLSPRCVLAPGSIVVHIQIAPEVRKGGVLATRLGSVKVELPGGWSLLNSTVAGQLNDKLKTSLKTAEFAISKTDYGQFAFQSAKLDTDKNRNFLFKLGVDGLVTQDQASKIIDQALTNYKLSYP